MSGQAKTEMSSEENSGGTAFSPLRKWWQSSRLFKQDLGLPPFLEPRDARWMDADWLQRSLAACYWPGYVPAPLFVPHIAGSLHPQSQKLTKWRVSMDVSHFSPSEISLSTRDDFLEVKGEHEERPDEHGFIARCFNRKYRLPAEVDASKITGTLYVDGILTVEAPLLDNWLPAATIIPIQVEMEGTAERQVKQEEDNVPQTEPGSCEAPNDTDIQPLKDRGEEAPTEVCSDRDEYGSATAGLQKHGERMEQEEEEEEEGEEEEERREKPAGEAHPSVPADDERSQQTLDTSGEADRKEAVEDEEIQGMASSGEDAEEISPPEEQELGSSPQSEAQGQELEAADTEQQHNE